MVHHQQCVCTLCKRKLTSRVLTLTLGSVVLPVRVVFLSWDRGREVESTSQAEGKTDGPGFGRESQPPSYETTALTTAPLETNSLTFFFFPLSTLVVRNLIFAAMLPFETRDHFGGRLIGRSQAESTQHSSMHP